MDPRLVVCVLAGVVLAPAAFVLNLDPAHPPLTDLHAYWSAGARLNAGLPLYDSTRQIGDPEWYGYPPLLAVVFRVVALAPFPVVGCLYVVGFGALLGAVVWWCGLRRRTVVGLAVLGYSLLFCLMVGQAEALVLGLLAVGSPAAIALAGHLKLLPALVALSWVAARDWRSLRRFVGWSVVLLALQFLLEPAGMLAFFDPGRYVRSDGLWYVVDFSLIRFGWPVWALVVGVLVVGLLSGRLGRRGAILLSVVAAPRLLVYQFAPLLAMVPPRLGNRAVDRPGGRPAASLESPSRRAALSIGRGHGN